MAGKGFLKKISRFQHMVPQIVTHRYQSSTNGPQFLGVQCNYTNNLQFITKESYAAIPTYRCLEPTGEAKLPAGDKLSNDTMVKMYRNMITINVMDNILYESQRQGRISFYMTNTGEEAVQIGSAVALTMEDMIYAQYREAGVLLWRGFPISGFMNQCYGNCDDEGKGRQMPVHYGSKQCNIVTISSPLTTQLPQAVGAAYAFKQTKKDACIVCYFGEGAASEGDAHAGFNFAATLSCPVIFICRNNGYAISTPSHEQFKSDGIAVRGPAYGIHTIRVDGNDVLAMYHATQAARQFCVTEKKPVLIEALTYRIGPHSTSDDSSAYRSDDEVCQWNNCTPILRFRRYIESLGLWNQEAEDELMKTSRKEVLQAFSEAEKKLKPRLNELFTDVYYHMPDHIRKQMLSLEKHIKEYEEHYPLKQFE